MKLNNYTYYFSLALLCTPALFGAATSNEPEQPQITLHDDQENGQAPETMTTLEERYQAAQQEQIAPASSSEQVSLADDRGRKRYQYPEETEPSTKKQHIGVGHVTLQTHDGGNEDIPLATARTYSDFIKSLTDEYKTELAVIDLPEIYSKTSLEVIASLLKSRSNHTTTPKLYDANRKALSPLPLDATFELIELADYLQLNDAVIFGALAKQLIYNHTFDTKIHEFLQSLSPATEKFVGHFIAKDYFLKLKEKRAKRNEKTSPDLLPDLIRPYFIGVSIQDLIDYGTNFKFQRNRPGELRYVELFLDEMYINDLAGLEHIPGIKNLTSLTLSGNQIPTIEAHAFASLPNLILLSMPNNGITVIKPYAFNGLSELLQLNLKNNQITTIEQHTFAGFSDLMRLDLTYNQISIVKPHAFTNLHNLLRVYLFDNPIAQNREERERIEEEVSTATNGKGRVVWGAP